jgi:XTP/dITP diphosphohydrolase
LERQRAVIRHRGTEDTEKTLRKPLEFGVGESRRWNRFFLATSNQGKLRDFRGMEPQIRVELLPGYTALAPVVEDGDTFEANARKKAEHYSRLAEDVVIADDSGLEVDALGGAPGVHSARFAGKHGDDEANNRLLLEKLRGMPTEKRTARFVCVLAAARSGRTLACFRGVAEGYVLDAPRGTHGFGYDPLFYSPEAGYAFAELLPERKAVFSHRGKAARELMRWADALK